MTTYAAPVEKRPSDDNDNALDTARAGPYNLTVQGGIAGALLIILGFILCFFGARFFRVTMFLIGFYFFGNITYVGMANGGVTSSTLLLVISIVVGIIGGLLMVCCSRLGVAILGALAFYSLGLWILGWQSGGVITSNAGRGIFLAVLVVVGFILGFVREHEMVIVGSAIVGAYSIVVGIDFFARTGFLGEADSFINSKNSINNRVGSLSGGEYALLATFIVLSLLGMAVQFRWWGRRNFRPAPAGNTVYTEKPSRFGGPGDCPPAQEMRHHRRSFDRVWPPALEVRLARIMLDDAPTTPRPYIIPPPPPITHYQELEQDKEPSIEHSIGPIRESSVGVFGTQSAPTTPASMRPMFYVSERKRNSILGPLSPSINTEMDRHLSQHSSPPRIDVKYHRHCKSIPQLQRTHSFAGYSGSYLEQKHSNLYSDSVDGSDLSASTDNTPQRFSDSSSPFQHPTTIIKEEKEEEAAEDTNNFGKDLFGYQARHSYPQFQEQLVSSVEAHPIQLNMPPIAKSHQLSVELSSDVGLDNEENPQIAKSNESSELSMDLPVLYLDSRPSISPNRKNPLSAASSRVTSRASSRSRSPSWKSNSALQSCPDEKIDHSNPHPTFHQQQHYPQQQEEEEDQRLVGRVGSSPLIESPNKFLQSGRGHTYATVEESDYRENTIEGEPPVESGFSPTFLDVISNDQGRWRSPTLSALASLSTSPGPNHYPIPSIESSATNWETMGSRSWSNGSASGRYSKNLISQEADMTAEIPLIEAHDEIALQDIWRMEEEERRDRYNIEGGDDDGGDVGRYGSIQDHIANMKGEQHAHEEANLIREILLSGQST
ncbi:hypothetical protein BGX27_011454 [Mortierella sp. AM989]|nr:hypothetical protein BGX27_011454 [Mortierella sp. AM989]